MGWLKATAVRSSVSDMAIRSAKCAGSTSSTLSEMMTDAGLEDVEYHNLSGGIVAVHTGFRY